MFWAPVNHIFGMNELSSNLIVSNMTLEYDVAASLATRHRDATQPVWTIELSGYCCAE